MTNQACCKKRIFLYNYNYNYNYTYFKNITLGWERLRDESKERLRGRPRKATRGLDFKTLAQGSGKRGFRNVDKQNVT